MTNLKILINLKSSELQNWDVLKEGHRIWDIDSIKVVFQGVLEPMRPKIRGVVE
jgi:hypothetical protein